ncbi:MAG: TRAP transporter TatT component family protein [Vicinamibacterales bacterium]
MCPNRTATQQTSTRWRTAVPLVVAILASGCSVKTYAINMVGNALASGDSVYETDDDLELVGAALPFGLKLTESLLAQSPNHSGLLLTACRGFVLYAYAYVDYPAHVAAHEDLDRARALRARARRLYLRGYRYGIRAIERLYPGFGEALLANPAAAVRTVRSTRAGRDVPLLYWTAASLGLAISVSRGDAALLARLPEVRALLDRAIELDEAWDAGALHEFEVTLAGSVPGELDVESITRHFDRAVELSKGRSAGAYLAYAEAVSVPQQNAAEFRALIARALAVDVDADPQNRLVNLLAHRRALWLASRVDELILEADGPAAEGK